MPAQPIYENLCRKGRALADKLHHEDNSLARTARRAALPNPPVGIEDEVLTLTARRDSGRVELSRHVAHCTDGCKRAPSSQQAPAFASPTPYDRAPHRSKPTMPPVDELAARIRAGETHEEIALELERHPQTIRQLISNAGWSPGTGQPRRQEKDDAPVLLKNFQYETWMDDALCGQTDPEAFFPDKGGSTREAKAICMSCDVAAECLDYALKNEERFGIWGGLSERERRKLARQIAETKDFPNQNDHIQETA